MIMFIYGFDFRTHLDAFHFVQLNTLNVAARVNFLALNMMHKIYNNTDPSYMCISFYLHLSYMFFFCVTL